MSSLELCASMRHARIRAVNKPSAIVDWMLEQIALAKRWVETWGLAAVDLERIRLKEIRELDIYKSLSRLCGSADYTKPPYSP